MKKIITFLLLAAMVVGCMVPAVISSAADIAISAESVEVMEGASTANVAVSISGNTGFAYAQLAVVFKSAELEAGEATSALFDTVSVKNIRANQIANYIPADASADDYAGFYVSIENASFENVAADGEIVDLAFDFVAPVVGATYNCYVTVVEACDADENEVTIVGELVEGAITYIKDENLGKYDEFTMFFAPDAAEIAAGTATVDVDLRVDANPGLWSIRCYVVYPNELTVNTINNGSVFYDSALNVGILDLDLAADNQVTAFKKLIEAEGIQTEGYHSTTLYYEPLTADEVITNSGVLAKFSFNVPADAQPGDTYDIKVYYATGDIFRANGGTDFTDLFPATYGAELTIKCDHLETTTDHKDATCKEAGYDRVICAACGYVVSETTIEATGIHTPGEPVTVESTCTVAGTTTISCTVCGDVLETTNLELADHTPGAEATCTDAQTCTVCGLELAAALGHTAGDPVIVKATCTEDGSKTVSCTVCGEVLSTEVIAASGHNYLQPGSTVIVPATCTEDGYTTKTCQVCGDVAVTDRTPAYGHTAGDPVVVESTCTVAGTSTTSCEDCGEVLEVTELPLAEHTYGDAVIVESTCTVAGTSTKVCEVCGYELVEELELLDHVLGEATVVDPTCTEAGSSKATCEVCGTEVEEVIEALGHTFEDGKCTVCGEADPDAEEEDNTPAPEQKPTKPNAPQSGDAMMYIIIALAVVLVASVALVVIRRKRNAQ